MLRKRLHELGMSRGTLAQLSGVFLTRVNKVLDYFEYLEDICEVLGLDFTIKEAASGYKWRKRQAEAKAHKIIGFVQNESRGVDAQTLIEMQEQTVHELMAGPGCELWAPLQDKS